MIKSKRECLFPEHTKVLAQRKTSVCLLSGFCGCTIPSKESIIDGLMYGLPRKPWKERAVLYRNPSLLQCLISIFKCMSWNMYFFAAHGAFIPGERHHRCFLCPVFPDQSSASSHEAMQRSALPCLFVCVCVFFLFLAVSGRTYGHAQCYTCTRAQACTGRVNVLLCFAKMPLFRPKMFRWPLLMNLCFGCCPCPPWCIPVQSTEDL